MGSRVVDRLVVVVGAVVDKKSVDSALGSIGAISIGILSAAAALAAFSIQQAAAIDETSTLAVSLRVTTEELTALEFAASSFGAERDKLIPGLRGLQAQLQAAGEGSEEVAKTFKSMGVSFKDVNGDIRTAVDVLPDLADGLASLSEGERAGVTLKLLGESGADLTRFLDAGSVGIREMMEAARDLGLVLDTETAEAGQRLTSSVGALRGVLRGLAFQVAGETIPVTTDFVDGLVDASLAADGIVQVGLDKALRTIGVAAGFAHTPTGKWAAALTTAAAAMGVAKGAPGLISGLSDVSPLLGNMATKFGAAVKKGGPFALVIAASVIAIDDMIVTAQGGDSAIRKLADAFGVGEETATAFAEAGGLITESWAIVPGLLDGVSLTAGVLWESMQPIIDELPGPLQRIAELFERLAEGMPTLSEGIEAIGDAFKFSAGGFTLLSDFMAGEGPGLKAPETTAETAANFLAGPLLIPASAVRGEALGIGASAGIQSARFSERREGSVLRESARIGAARAASLSRPRAAPIPFGADLSGIDFGGSQPQGINVNVNVSPTSDAREQSRAAGQEVERQTFQALTAVEAL